MSFNSILNSQQINLLNAINDSHFEKTKLIVTAGLLLNFHDEFGFTPLHYAVNAGPDFVGLLLDHGAKIITKNQHYSPFQLACITQAYEVVKIILQKVPECRKMLTLPTGELSIAVRNENRELAKILINSFDDPQEEFNYGPLHQAVENKNYEALQELIKSSSTSAINQQDMFGYTPLHLAVFANSPEIVQLLIKQGADLTISTPRGHNVFDLANQKGFSNIIDVLQPYLERSPIYPSSLASEISAWMLSFLKGDKLFFSNFNNNYPPSKPAITYSDLEDILIFTYRKWVLEGQIEKISLAKILQDHGFNNQIKNMDFSNFAHFFKFLDIDGVDFINSQFNGDMKNSSLQTKFTDCIFRAFQCQNCEFKPGTEFNNVTFRDTFIDKSNFHGVIFHDNHFFYSRFIDSTFNNIYASNNYLFGSEIWNVTINDSYLEKTILTETDIYELQGVEVSFELSERTKPLIGILGNVYQLQDFTSPGFMAAEPYLRIKQGGLIPFLIPREVIYSILNSDDLSSEAITFLDNRQFPLSKPSIIQELLGTDIPAINALNNFAESLANKLDGLWLPGGPDIDYRFYSQVPVKENNHYGQLEDQLFEFALVDQFIKQNKPILGICHGAQLLNVYFGGTLLQHVIGHDQVIQDIHVLTHEGRFAQALTGETVKGISAHHQAIDILGSGLEKVAEYAAVIKAAQGIEHPVYLSQFHPEYLLDDDNLAMLDTFFTAVKQNYAAKSMNGIPSSSLDITEIFTDHKLSPTLLEHSFPSPLHSLSEDYPLLLIENIL